MADNLTGAIEQIGADIGGLRDGVGARTVSLTEDGQPYLDPATGTHFILSDVTGTPYISRSITPTLTLS